MDELFPAEGDMEVPGRDYRSVHSCVCMRLWMRAYANACVCVASHSIFKNLYTPGSETAELEELRLREVEERRIKEDAKAEQDQRQ